MPHTIAPHTHAAVANPLATLRSHMRLALLAEEMNELAMASLPPEYHTAAAQAGMGPGTNAAGRDDYATVMKPLQVGLLRHGEALRGVAQHKCSRG